MFSKLVASQLSFAAKRCFSTTKQANFKVAVAGAGGGIGQPLSLLLKLNPMVTELKLYDLVRTPGVAADLSHIETAAKVTAFEGVDSMKEAFSNMDVIVIPAGVPRKPGMSRDDLFDSNAAVVRDIAKVIAEVSPNAMVLIITNPVNSCLPIACEVMKKAGKLNPQRMFGVTTLDIVRSNAFVGEIAKKNPKDVIVPVIGGHAGITILPLLSQANVKLDLSEDKQIALIKKIQDAGTEVVKAKAGAGSATLSMGYAGARFASSIMKAMSGETNVVECAYVMSDVSEAKYFASPLLLGKNGVEKNLGIGKLSKLEEEMYKKLLPELKSSIKKGEDFVNKS